MAEAETGVLVGELRGAGGIMPNPASGRGFGLIIKSGVGRYVSTTAN
jgi:hypothetical protein